METTGKTNNPLRKRMKSIFDECEFLETANREFMIGLNTSIKQSDRELFYQAITESILERFKVLKKEVDSVGRNIPRDYLHPLIDKLELNSARSIIWNNNEFFDLTTKQRDEILKEIDEALLIYEKTLN